MNDRCSANQGNHLSKRLGLALQEILEKESNWSGTRENESEMSLGDSESENRQTSPTEVERTIHESHVFDFKKRHKTPEYANVSLAKNAGNQREAFIFGNWRAWKDQTPAKQIRFSTHDSKHVVHENENVFTADLPESKPIRGHGVAESHSPKITHGRKNDINVDTTLGVATSELKDYIQRFMQTKS